MTETQPTELERRFGKTASERWAQLLRHLDLIDGFSFVVVLVPDETASRICATELEKYLKTRGQRLERLEYTTPENLRENLALDVLTRVPNDEHLGAIWLSNVTNRFDPKHNDWDVAWRYAAARVNESRDALRARYNGTLIVVGAPWLQETLREAAPDWWSIRSLVIRLQPDFTANELSFKNNFPVLESIHAFPQDQSENALLDPDFVLEQAARLRGVKGQEKNLIQLLNRAFAALMNRERSVEAEQYAREMLELEETIGESILEKAGTYTSIGYALLDQGRLEEAEECVKKALEWQELGGASLTVRAITLDLLGRVFLNSDRLLGAEQAFGVVLKWLEFDENSLQARSFTMYGLGHVLSRLGRLEEAEKAFRTTLEWTKQSGSSLTNRGLVMCSLAIVLQNLGRSEEAESAFQTAINWGESNGDSLVSRGLLMYEYSQFLFDVGRVEEAEKAFRTALEWQETGGASFMRRGIMMGVFGLMLEKSGRFEEAEAAFKLSREWQQADSQTK
jgi:tetratricopeptide (TPR) repeat protein